MATKLKVNFQFSAVPALPMTGVEFVTDPISSDNSMALVGPWSIQFEPGNIPIVGGPPLYTLEVTNDGVSWAEYSPVSTDVDVNIPLEDTHFAFFNMRLRINPNGATEGNGSIVLYEKGR